jgi:alpha-tubulin suppressor-like RCC1 family protein
MTDRKTMRDRIIQLPQCRGEGFAEGALRVRPGYVLMLALLLAASLSAAAGSAVAVADPGAQLFGWGANDFGQLGDGGSGAATPREVAGVNHVLMVASGDNYTLALRRAVRRGHGE